MRTVRTFLALAFSLAALPASAAWQDQVSPADLDRLDHLPQIRDAALTDAAHGDSRPVDRIMRPESHVVPAKALIGDWRCRQIKLGGMTSTMVYDGWSRCNIRPIAGGLALEKRNGSQRFIGRLFPEDGAWVYLGASSVRGEPGHDYSGASPALGAQVTPDDQIGLLTGIGDNHLRLEIPAVQESLLDVVEFAR